MDCTALVAASIPRGVSIHINDGTLIEANMADNEGGGLFGNSGTILLNRSLFHKNIAPPGGGMEIFQSGEQPSGLLPVAAWLLAAKQRMPRQQAAVPY